MFSQKSNKAQPFAHFYKSLEQISSKMDVYFDQSTVIRIDKRLKLIKEGDFELLVQKEELIIQFSKVDHELQNLTCQICKRQLELKMRRQS